jgi:hypothetical protein
MLSRWGSLKEECSRLLKEECSRLERGEKGGGGDVISWDLETGGTGDAGGRMMKDAAGINSVREKIRERCHIGALRLW